jgi:adenylate cyclase class 2
MAASDPYVETEVKIPFVQGAQAARRLVESKGYRVLGDRILESDQLFDRAGGELRRNDQLLRLRRSGDRATVTYKGPGRRGRHKSREEIEFDISDAASFEQVLERLGYSPGFRYEKFRTKFAAPGEPGFVTIDETPIGVFLELEGPPDWIDQTAARLDISQAEYLTRSYAAMYQEYRRVNAGAPADMIFEDSAPQ